MRAWAADLASGLVLGTVPCGDMASLNFHYRLTLLLPDSLTTWEIHGVSLSRSKGEVTLPTPQAAPFPSP